MDMEQVKTGYGMRILDNKTLQLALPGGIGLYLLLSFAWPATRDFVTWQNTEWWGLVYVCFQLMFGIGLFALLLGISIIYFPKIETFLSKFFNRPLVLTAGFVILALCLIFTATHTPGWWWTWLTFGVQVATIMIVYLMLEKRINKAVGIIVGIAISSLAIGSWEVPYQAGIHLIHGAYYFDQNTVMYAMRREIMTEFAFIIPAVLLLWIFHNRYHIINFNKWFWIFLSITVGLYVYWFLSGFWTEIRYDWATGEFTQFPVEWFPKMIFRLSKVTLALALIVLLLPKKGGLNALLFGVHDKRK